MQYAQQCKFIYGWDYVGSIDGERALFDTREEAQADLDSDMAELRKLGHSPHEWRVRPYVEADDTKHDLS